MNLCMIVILSESCVVLDSMIRDEEDENKERQNIENLLEIPDVCTCSFLD